MRLALLAVAAILLFSGTYVVFSLHLDMPGSTELRAQYRRETRAISNNGRHITEETTQGPGAVTAAFAIGLGLIAYVLIADRRNRK